MLARTLGYGLSGVSGFAVKVEVYAATGMPALEIIGLPDASVKESRDRVSAAIVNSGFTMPISRLTVNLAPADQRKEGPAFDLPIAISILMASGQLEGMDLTQTLMLGELSLDGSLHPVRGALPMVISASEQGIVDIILPEGNAEEVACIQGLRVYPASSLRQVVNHLKGREPIPVQQQRQYSDVVSAVKCAVDMAQVQGQVGARRALEVAASGGHNLLMVGTPGSGKTMLARCLPGILPPLTFSESLETTRIHSIAGQNDCVVLTSIQFAQTGVEVAAQALDHQLRVFGAQDGFAAQAGGADDGAGRQIIQRCIVVGNESIAGIFAGRDGGQHEAFRHHHRHVLHRMHGEVGLALLHRHFEFLDEQALAADFGERPVENLVALGGHAENDNFRAGI